MEIVARKYGEVDAKEFVPGAEILLETENTENSDNSENESDEEWVDVSHSEDEIGDDEGLDDEECEEEDDDEESEKEDDDDVEGEDEDDEKNVNETDHSTCTQGSLTDKVIPKKKVVTKKEQLAEKKEKAAQVSSMRILTDEDFKRIEIAQLNKQMTSAKNRKRPAEPDETSR